ncbi:MAG TPA: Lrp/AsnC family transcriptional regulator [Rhodospirillales bacterium]|nr:Lrp/AsnC family transcriptional regulator [Rhodospirillales bacterium]
MSAGLDDIDKAIINGLQGGFPLSEEPFAEAGMRLGLDEDDLIARIQKMLDDGALTRFGPMYHAEKLGGGLSLAAMKVPEADFDAVAEKVNAHPEVAHNYARDHAFNMWFVLATGAPGRIEQVIAAIEEETGLKVYNMPKIEEFYIGLSFGA